ncbi:hypothetical protein GCM10008955_06790 [Deinococcus malanensis]|uniref:Inosine/uridine-preferring nucleoside hydrolase domain-containing protein n=1 Tax=Deinococcus malanensis TaxID=1706855 RepID=A0ABQ2EL20_9DEIO|nr:nucleoside hydrolase [Deinococcus malanensis]GGK15962.1 hypothetical protein GCM10008955_06790 [Deinococcus malanensis]
MTKTPLHVILDGDPGLDDAVAWLLALASPELKVLGVTTVHGNVDLSLTTRNAGVTLALGKSTDVPVYAGADRPLIRELMGAAAVHGDTGLPANGLPDPYREPEAEHAVNYLIRAAREQPGEVTLIATGPLTNVALAFRMEPALPQLLREVMWMGGSTAHGNRTPAAEFNVLADPHAADVVFRSGAALRMVGLNVTMQCVATPDRVEALRQLGTPVGLACAEMLTFYAAAYRRRYNLSGGALHDPLAVAAVLWPDLLTWQAMHVEVDTHEGADLGRTVCDLYGVTGKPANARVAVGVDDPTFFSRLLERLSRF